MNDAIVAKMYLAETTSRAYNPTQIDVLLRVVSRGEENKAWCASTPNGELKLSIANPAAQAIFLGNTESPLGAAVNAEYEVTIRKITAAPES